MQIFSKPCINQFSESFERIIKFSSFLLQAFFSTDINACWKNHLSRPYLFSLLISCALGLNYEREKKSRFQRLLEKFPIWAKSVFFVVSTIIASLSLIISIATFERGHCEADHFLLAISFKCLLVTLSPVRLWFYSISFLITIYV